MEEGARLPLGGTAMNDFKNRLKKHIEHIKSVGAHCTSEETTKQALILPFLDILGFSPYNPTKVLAEYSADFPGVKAHERVDYALFCHGNPVMFIEAKAYAEAPGNHCPQLSRYFNATPDVTVAVITNGREWKFFTDLDNKNVMDATPFLTIDLLNATDNELAQLYRFRYDQFEPEKLRSLAEESTYFSAFSSVISASLRNVDLDFVRYVAGRSSVSRPLTAKFLETIAPIVRQAVEKAVSDMVVSGLSVPAAPAQPEPAPATRPEECDEVHEDNPKIVTTVAEKRLYTVLNDILQLGDDLTLKDTESYCGMLYQSKTNRWILRYRGDGRVPNIELILPMTDSMRAEATRAGLEVLPNGRIVLDKPQDLYRITGLLYDCLDYCRNDENFVRSKREE